LPLPLGAVHNRRNLTYVGNLTSAIGAALERGPAGTLVICDAQAVSTPELIAALAKGMERRALLFPAPLTLLNFLGWADMVRRLTGSLEADCGKAQRMLGWTPQVSASDGLGRTGAWFAAQ
jgi:nucleoside-diphosphate-sugar epimerase